VLCAKGCFACVYVQPLLLVESRYVSSRRIGRPTASIVVVVAMPRAAPQYLLLLPRVAIPSSGLDRAKMQEPVIPRRKVLAPQYSTVQHRLAVVRRCNAHSRFGSCQTLARRSEGKIGFKFVLRVSSGRVKLTVKSSEGK